MSGTAIDPAANVPDRNMNGFKYIWRLIIMENWRITPPRAGAPYAYWVAIADQAALVAAAETEADFVAARVLLLEQWLLLLLSLLLWLC